VAQAPVSTSEEVTLSNPMRTGERIQQAGLLPAETVQHILATAASFDEPSGKILSHSTNVVPRLFYQQLAEQLDLTYVDLQATRPEMTLLFQDDIGSYILHDAIPFRRANDGILIATSNPTSALKRWAEARFEASVTFVITSPRDIVAALANRFGNHLLQDSCFALYNAQPRRSAYKSLPARLWTFVGLGLLACLISVILAPVAALTLFIALVNCAYLISIGFKWWLYRHHRNQTLRPTTLLADQELPIYTVLIPLYDEAASVPGLLKAMRAIDYPKHRLDIKLVLEADDQATLEAIQRERPENYFDIIRVPYQEPRTKPKACNYALHFARGRYVTIYDAEDRPDPQQLRKAVTAFRQLPDTTVCMQARLNYYNWEENLLTKWFAIEYASLFDIMLPGLHCLRMPIPLGGTSNHFHLQRLRELGEWDPFNVTEDADLGIRLAAHQFQTALLPSVTLEEAPIFVSIWMKQRSRWIKGYIQTWLVHMRRSNHTRKRLGWRGFIGLQVFVGLPAFLFLCAPIFWGIFILSLTGALPFALPSSITYSCLVILVLGIANHWFFAWKVTQSWQWHRMGLAILSYPFYWFLHIWASFIAVYQLMVKPYYWEKTPHGITRYRG